MSVPAPAATANKKLDYRPDIDGLRAVAVLAVLFYHANLGASGGFVGVDIFFVISGYLITGIILKDQERGQFQMFEFWSRRVRRIFPALLVVVLFCLAAGWFVLLPIDFDGLGQSVMAQALFVSNFYFWLHTDYFSPDSSTVPLLHTWSLAVEEQFYLLFPFFLIGLRQLSDHSRQAVVSVLCALSFGFSIYCSYYHSTLNFYLLPSRAWELLAGALATMLPAPRLSPGWPKESLAWVSLLAILFAIFFFNNDTRIPGLAAALPCGGAAFLIWVNRGSTSYAGKLLSLPPLVFVGLISYSLYLWHWPLLAFSKYSALGPLGVTHRLLLLAGSVALATLSWKWVETPFRRRTLFKSRAGIVGFAGIMSTALVVLGFAVQETEGFPSRLPAQVLTYMNGANDRGNRQNVGLKDVNSGNFIKLGDPASPSPPKLFLWGDSQAMTYLSVLDALCREHSVVGLAATHFSMVPLLGFVSRGPYSLNDDSVAYSEGIANFIQEKQIHNVIFGCEWGTSGDDTSPVRNCLKKTIERLEASNVRIWIILQVPRPGIDVPRELALFALHGRKDQAGVIAPLDNVVHDRQIQDQIFQGIASPEVTLLDPTPFLMSPQNEIIIQSDGRSLYFDGRHLSTVGASRLRSLFDPIVASIAKGS